MSARKASSDSNKLALLWFGLPVVIGIILVFLLVKGGLGLFRHENGNSFGPSISADGRYIVFASYDAGLVDDDDVECDEPFSCSDIFVKDMVTGEITMVSTDSQGVAINENSGHRVQDTDSAFGISEVGVPSISDDGRYVVFGSGVTRFVGASQANQAYLKDRQTGELTPVVDSEGEDISAHHPVISGDGRFVAFWSSMVFTGDDTNDMDLFIKDLSTGEIELISGQIPGGEKQDIPVPGAYPQPPTTPDGKKRDIPLAAPYSQPSLSPDGRFVAFAFPHVTEVPRKQSRNSGDVIMAVPPQPGQDSGGVVSGYQEMTETFGWDVFVKDRQTGETRIVSTSSEGKPADGNSQRASITADGRFVAFESSATNLVAEGNCLQEARKCMNVYLKDLESGETRLLSKLPSGAAMNDAGAPAISRDGEHVAFTRLTFGMPQERIESKAGPLVKEIVYVSDVKKSEAAPAFPEITPSVSSFSSDSNILPLASGPAGYRGPFISADGRFLVFSLYAYSLGEEDRRCKSNINVGEPIFPGGGAKLEGPCREIYLKDMQTGEISRVSKPSDS